MDLKNYKLYLKISFVCFVLFIIISVLFTTKISYKFDTFCYKLLCSIRTETLTEIMKFITNLASTKITLIIGLIFLVITINKKNYGSDILLIIISQSALNTFIKSIFKRPRLTESILVYEKSYSFPSGHTMTAVVMYGFIIYLAFKYIKNRNIRLFIVSILNIIIILVGVSRLYLGAHYLTDVLASLFLGISFLFVTIVASEIIKSKSIFKF